MAIKRRNQWSVSPWRRAAMGLAAGASNALASYSRGRSRGLGSQVRGSKRQRVVTNSVFQQHDFNQLYRRRPAPRRVRQRAKRSFNNFIYNMDRIQGMQTTMINNYQNLITAPTGSDNAQLVAGFSMYGGDNTVLTNSTYNDLWRIWYNHFGAYPSSADALGKLRFRSCTMDFQVFNNNPDDSVFVEVYNVQNRKKDPLRSADSRWIQSLDSNSPVVTGSNLTQSFFKCTPFDASGFGEYWKITNRKKYLMQAGQTITFQVRDAKNYMIDGKQFNYGSTTLPGVTEDVLFVVYGVTINTSGSPATQSYPGPANVEISCVKTYHYYETQQSNNIASQYVS